MRKQNSDGMVRITQDIYNIIRQYCTQRRVNIRDIVNEAVKEWVGSHIDKEERKLIDKVISIK